MKTKFILFSCMNFTHEKISHAFNLPWKIYNCWNVHQKNNMRAKKQQHQIVAPKIRTEIGFLDILTKSNAS